MKIIKIAAPAKINLTLEILNKREDGFHNINSVMQAISLYDYITIKVEKSPNLIIELAGNSNKIPYNEKNLVHKATTKFLEKTNINNKKIQIYIEKNIPVEAGLAGGSTDAAATFWGLNKLFDERLTTNQIEELCATLGSDLNFCLKGGTALCESRGEKITQISPLKSYISLIKPKNLGISAKEAYTKYSQLQNKPVTNYTEKIIENFDKQYLYNSFEQVLIKDYKELKNIKTSLPNAIMSGSGPTCFVLEKNIPHIFNTNEYEIIENLQFIPDGVKCVN